MKRFICVIMCAFMCVSFACAQDMTVGEVAKYISQKMQDAIPSFRYSGVDYDVYYDDNKKAQIIVNITEENEKNQIDTLILMEYYFGLIAQNVLKVKPDADSIGVKFTQTCDGKTTRAAFFNIDGRDVLETNWQYYRNDPNGTIYEFLKLMKNYGLFEQYAKYDR